MKNKIVNINDLMNVCGYGTSNTQVNNGYGCNHPEQEDTEDVFMDGDGNTEYCESEEVNAKQGKCFASGCPLGHLCTPDDAREDSQYKDDLKGMTYEEAEDYLEPLELVTIDEELWKILNTNN